jgi:tryptophan synthase alpha chain
MVRLGPLLFMTYVNPVFRSGFGAFLAEAEGAGVAGAIVPDLPIDEADGWIGACDQHGVASIQLAAPGTSPDRLSRIAAASKGFVYCVATYGVTGSRGSVAGTARELVERLRPLTDLPLLVGVGVGTPEQAAQVATFADGAIVGSALMARLLESGPDGLIDSARAFRAGLPLN